MKRIFYLLGLFTMFALQVNAQSTTEKRKIDHFDEISLRVSANLYVEQGDEADIEITANEKTLDKLIIEIIDHKLIIRFSIEDRWFNNFEPGKIEIRVITPDIDLLSLQGSGNIIAEKTIQTHTLNLSIAGSGDIKMADVRCERLEANITGSGDIIVSGKQVLRELNVNIAGSGDVMAHQLETEACYINVAGSGDCDVYVTEYLDAKIFGSGDISYKGEPSLKSSITGSGRIHQK